MRLFIKLNRLTKEIKLKGRNNMRKEMKLSTKAIQIALLVCIALLMCVIPFSLLAEEGIAQAEEDENAVEFKL